MTFETLLCIHRLLKEEEARRADYNNARDYLEDLKDSGASREDLAQAKAHKESADRIHTKILRALNDFEEQDWR